MLDISADNSQFEQSLKFFKPPLEHHEDTLVSDRERVKIKGGARPDQLLSDDSVLKQFIQNDVKKFNASKTQSTLKSNKVEDTPESVKLQQDPDKFKKFKVVKKVGFEGKDKKQKNADHSLSEIFGKDNKKIKQKSDSDFEGVEPYDKDDLFKRKNSTVQKKEAINWY